MVLMLRFNATLQLDTVVVPSHLSVHVAHTHGLITHLYLCNNIFSGRLSKCQRKLKAASMVKMIGAFKPKCNADGSYAKVQCHPSTGYCWCSTKRGKKIPGTSVRGKKPKCRSRKRKSDPKKGTDSVFDFSSPIDNSFSRWNSFRS